MILVSHALPYKRYYKHVIQLLSIHILGASLPSCRVKHNVLEIYIVNTILSEASKYFHRIII